MGERAAVSAALFQEGRSRMTAKQLPDDTYLDKIYTMLAQIEQEEGAAMDAAARAAYASIDGGGLLHVFSTGHSHMIVEEMFYRSGGLVPVNPILSDELMLHTGAITSTHMERMPGKAAAHDPRHPADHRRRVHLRKPVHRAAHRTEDRKPVSCAGADAAGPVQRQSARRRRIQYQRGGGVSGPYQSAVLRMR